MVADLAAIGAVLRDTEHAAGGRLWSAASAASRCAWTSGASTCVVTASQKSLMCPPGLAIAAVSEKAMRVIDAAHGIPRFFFDFRRAKTSLDKGETPFTPPVSLIVGLREALAMINEEGLPAVLARHARLCGRAARRLRGARLPDVSGSAVFRDRHRRCRARRARRVGDRAPHVRELSHRDRRPAHQAAQSRDPHRHDGIRRPARTSSRTCITSNAPCAISAARRRRAPACRPPLPLLAQ